LPVVRYRTEASKLMEDGEVKFGDEALTVAHTTVVPL
jgi:hypothetical protein